MTPPFNILERISRDTTAHAQSLADVAAWEARKRDHERPPVWFAVGLVVVALANGIALGYLARLVWEWVG